MGELLLSPGWVDPYDCKSEKEERKLPGEKLPALTPVSDGAEFERIWPACQGKILQGTLAKIFTDCSAPFAARVAQCDLGAHLLDLPCLLFELRNDSFHFGP
jgi:hypothetical protein